VARRQKTGMQKTGVRSPFTISRLDRYVFGQLALGLAVTTIGLVALIWLTQSLRFIQLIIQRGLSPFVFVHLTGLLLPSFVAVILPITVFIVTMFVYTRLTTDRELVVMRASGMSDGSIARPALAMAALAMVVCFVLNVWLVPASLHDFSKCEFQIRNMGAAFLLEPGVFTPIPGHITVYIQSRDQNSVLHGILIEDQRQKGAPATILARTGSIAERGSMSPPSTSTQILPSWFSMISMMTGSFRNPRMSSPSVRRRLSIWRSRYTCA
jgi:lipopolysaccharide export system permease protein